MRLYRTAILAGAIAIACTPAQAGYHHVIAPVVSKSVATGGGGSSSGNWHLCPTPAGIFICAVTVGIIVHEVMGPKCARRGLPNGYDTPTLWRPYCRRDPKPIAVRG